MKKILLAAAAALTALVACQKNEVAAPAADSVLYATIEETDATKTCMDANNNILWSEGDKIVAFMKASLGLQYQVTSSSVGKASARFEEVGNNGGGLNAGTEWDHNIAYYPYSETVECLKSGNNYALNVVLPSEQTYAPESFGNASMAMVAVSENNNITFRNVLGGMKLQLRGTQKVKSISLQGKNNEKLSGEATVTAYTDDTKPAITLSSSASTSMTLDCGSGVQLSESTATEFIISLPPVAFTKGFTVTITDTDAKIYSIDTDKANTVFRSSILVMPEVLLESELENESQEGDYIDEYGINHGQGVKIGETVWAPVNCGYHATDFKYGKLYQWGRKYGLGYEGDIYDVNGSYTGTYSDSSVPTIEYGPVSLSTGQSKSNEKYFYTSRDAFYNDWLIDPDDELWDSGVVENPVKTEYDPCPDGWRVPTYTELSNLRSHQSSWTTNNNQVGYWFSGSEPYSSSVPRVFFPAAGFRLSGGGPANDRGNEGRYWSSRPYYYNANGLNFYNGSTYMDNSKRANGYSVRCVQEGKSTPPTETPKGYENLSADGTANSYIVSEAGDYAFETVKGNSRTSVGTVSEVGVLWESFGTSTAPSVGDLVKDVSYSDGYILFSTADNFREGNAVIAAKNSSGEILWSWHIWLTDEPEGQVYYNNAGTMMDRNLGATSATPGDVDALGLLYQWGRKDPFLGSSNISSIAVAKSTGSWPSTVSSSSSNGTIDYAVKNPMTFITWNSNNGDWYYTGSSSIDNTRWQSEKTIYDPCPAGWRVPDGGNNGVWSKALGSSSYYYDTYDSSNKGINFSGKFGSSSTIWYPASGYRSDNDGSMINVVNDCVYWSVTPTNNYASILYFLNDGFVGPSEIGSRAYGGSVRCLQE